MRFHSIVVIAVVLVAAVVVTQGVAVGATERSPVSALAQGADAVDALSAVVRTGLSDQGMEFEKLVKLGVSGGDTFWVGSASEGRVCLVIRHQGVGADWVAAASCLPSELMKVRALPLNVWTQTTGTRAALVPDGVDAASVENAIGLAGARLEFGNLLIPAPESWTSEIITELELADGNSIRVDLPSGPSAAERGQ